MDAVEGVLGLEFDPRDLAHSQRMLYEAKKLLTESQT